MKNLELCLRVCPTCPELIDNETQSHCAMSAAEVAEIHIALNANRLVNDPNAKALGSDGQPTHHTAMQAIRNGEAARAQFVDQAIGCAATRIVELDSGADFKPQDSYTVAQISALVLPPASNN